MRLVTTASRSQLRSFMSTSSARAGARRLELLSRERLEGEGGKELHRRMLRMREEVVCVEHVIGGDRLGGRLRRAELEDGQALLPARAAAEPPDQPRGFRHDGRDVASAVVLTALIAGDLLEVADELVDPAHGPDRRIECRVSLATSRAYALLMPREPALLRWSDRRLGTS